MNLRQFSIALLVSALPISLPTGAESLFNQGDFKVSERTSDDGETQLKVKLSKSGKAKLKRLAD